MTSTHRYPPEVAPDHFVVAAASLEQAVDWIEDKLGTRVQPGGRHVAMGTHNALLRLGARLYFELIAIDPHGSAPQRPRWFDLDEPRMRAALAEGPALIHWAVRTRERFDERAIELWRRRPVITARWRHDHLPPAAPAPPDRNEHR